MVECRLGDIDAQHLPALTCQPDRIVAPGAAQIERFAPGVRERIVKISTRSSRQIAADNANYVGGDIATGANDPLQLVFRPRPALDPYATGVDGVYLCSAATSPGAGAHGMCGFLAAQRAIAATR